VLKNIEKKSISSIFEKISLLDQGQNLEVNELSSYQNIYFECTLGFKTFAYNYFSLTDRARQSFVLSKLEEKWSIRRAHNGLNKSTVLQVMSKEEEVGTRRDRE
jgi:hypothetical protein